MSVEEKQALLAKIETALDTIRPHLQADGGDIEVVDVTEDMHVQIKWLGNCEGCSMSGFTMKAGIEEAIRSQVPSIQGIEPVNGVLAK